MTTIRHKILPFTLACTMGFVSAVKPVYSEEITAEGEEPVPEETTAQEADIENDGSFSFDAASADINEGESFILKLQRSGEDLPETSVTLSLIDISAKYGTDYTIRILSEEAEAVEPEAIEEASSIMQEIENNPDSIIDAEIIPADEELVEQSIDEINGFVGQQLSEYASENPDQYVIPVEELHEETGKSELSQAFSAATGLEDDNLPMSSDGSAVLDINSLLGGYTSDLMEEFAGQFSAAKTEVDFAEGETAKYIRIDTVEDEEAEGNLLFMAAIFAASDNALIGKTAGFTGSIVDNEPWEAPALSFSEDSYTAEDGYLSVTIERNGIKSGFTSVHLSTSDGNAVSGRDYSEVDAQVDFMPGVSERILKIPVRSKYLDETSDFTLTLTDASNGEIEQSSAEGIITASSGNYEITAANLRAETNAISSSSSNDLSSRSVKLDLSGGTTTVHENAGGGWDGDKIHLTANGWVWTPSNVEYCTKDFGEQIPVKAYRAVRVDWEKSGGGSSETLFRTNYDDYTITWGWSDTLATTFNSEEWERQTVDILLTDHDDQEFRVLEWDYMTTIEIYNNHNGSPFSSSSDLNIYSVEALPRPMEITAEVYNKDTLKFVDADGRLVTYDQANLPGVGAFNISGQTDKAIQYIGDTVTVTTDDTYTYIKALYIGDKKVTADYPAGTRSASFKLDQDFYKKYSREIKMPWTKDPAAQLKIRVELGQYDAPVIIHDDDQRGKIGFGFEANNNGIHKGDYVSIKQSLYPAYSATHTHSMIRMSYKQRADALDLENAFILYNRGSKDSYTFRNIYTDVNVYPVFEEKDNRLVVRVDEDSLSKFTKNSGFLSGSGERNAEGYVDFEAVSADEIQAGKRYELSAEAIDGYVAVWQPVFKESRYSQSSYFFEADPDPVNNVVMLTAEKADDLPYSISGEAYYSNYSLVSGAEGEAWMAAKGVMVLQSPSAYGITDDEGKFQSIPAYGISGCKVQYRVSAMGKTEYRTVTLSKGGVIDFGNDITAYDVPAGTVTVSPVNRELPYVSAVSLLSGSASGSLIAYMGGMGSGGIQNSFTVFINNEHVPYTDNNGEEKTETVKKVQLYAYDPSTNVLRGQIGVDGVRISGGDNDDRSVWQISCALEEGTTFYEASDRIFVRITTDRKQADVYDENGNLVDFENFNETVYPDLYTGMVLSSTQPIEAPTFDLEVLDMDLDKYIQLPFFNLVNCTLVIGQMALSLQMLPGNVHRFCIGRVLTKNDMMNDTKENFDGFKDGVSKISAFGKKVKGEGKIAPVKNTGLFPFVGIYLDFAPSALELSNQAMNVDFTLIGGGFYGGVQAFGQFNFYVPIYCIPTYFGIQIITTGYVAAGFHDAEEINYHTLHDGTADLKDGLDPDFTFKAEGWFAIYAGVGLACTLGVRGGVGTYMQYIYNPTIQQVYPHYEVDGGRLTSNVRIWIDAFLFCVPIPFLTLVDVPFGYMKQMEEEKASGNSTGDLTDTSGVKVRDVSAPSRWLPARNMLSMSPTQGKETVLLRGGYDHADPQLLDMGEEGVLLVFLNIDETRPERDQTVLMYSIYKDGIWSEPEPIGDERTLSTADFQPDLCDAGDSVMISWMSRENVPYEDSLEYLGTMDVYTCMFDKATHEVTEIECLSEGDFNDVGYYNCNPAGVYDELSGDRMVYYQKSAAEEKAVDEDLYQNAAEDAVQLLANVSPTQNGSFITYLLYDHSENDGKGGWARTHIYENEVSSAASRRYLIDSWGGQRFLASPINEEDWEVNRPVIIDFDAISYNGIALYAYTVDKDNSLDTEYDRDLFLQVYDFDTHRTFHPVRIKNDTVSDARPTLVRSLYTDADGSLKAHTWLFWLEGVSIAAADENGEVIQQRGVSAIRYLDAGELIQYGINDDGTIGKDAYDIADETHVLYYQSLGQNDEPSFGNYIAYVDQDDDLYVSWTQSVTDEESGNASQEIYATALIDKGSGTAWSDPVKLTDSGMVNDETAVVTDKDNRLITVSNRFMIDPEDEEGKVSNLSLIATAYQNGGSLEAVDVSYPNEAPLAGETISPSVKIRNTGLSPAEGYTVKIYEVRNGSRSSKPLYSTEGTSNTFRKTLGLMADNTAEEETDSDERIVPGQETPVTFEWTMPDDLKEGDTLGLYVEVTEKNVDVEPTKTAELSGPAIGAKLELVSTEVKEEQDGFYLCYEIRNAGNVASNGNIHMKAQFNDLYNEGYEGDWLDAPIDPLEPGESRYYQEKMEINDEVFTRGFANGFAELYDENGERTYIGTDFIAAMEFPYHITVNDDPALEEITLKAGESLELSGTYGPADYYKDGTVQFATGNGEIAHMEGNRLVADEAGETLLRVFVSPYGGEKLIRIKVAAKDSQQPSEQPEQKPENNDAQPSANTSDSSNKTLYAGLFAGSLLLLAAVLWLRKREK